MRALNDRQSQCHGWPAGLQRQPRNSAASVIKRSVVCAALAPVALTRNSPYVCIFCIFFFCVFMHSRHYITHTVHGEFAAPQR